MAENRSHSAEFDRFQATNAQRSVILKAVIWSLIMLFVLAVIFFFGTRLFAVRNIIVNGLDHYTYSQVLDVADLSEGKVLFLISEKRISQSLTERFAYVKSVKVEKQYPDTVTITLEAEEPQFYIEIQGEYFLLTKSLKVLERYYNEAKLLEAAPDVQFVKIPTIARAVVCKPLEFAEIGKSRHTDEALNLLLESRLYSGVTEIDFSNRFDMTILYENRLEIHLGSYKEFDAKLDLALGMIHAYSDNATGKLEIIFNADDELQGVAIVKDPKPE
jgi:hypothetical protein